VALALVPLAHPFHLDRFVLPGALGLWALAGLGLARRWGTARARSQLGAGAALAALGLSSVLVPNHLLARIVGLDAPTPEAAAWQRHVLDEEWGLGGSVPTAGLPRAVADELFDRLAEVVGPGERVAWIGMSSECSPAALHLGLLERGGSRERFLRDAHRRMDLVPVPGADDPLAPPSFADPEERDRFLRELLDPFDVVLLSSPPDLRDRPGRRFLTAEFHAPLVERLGYAPQAVGTVTVPRPPGAPLDVHLFALRRE
jgi:hypothetical protein